MPKRNGLKTYRGKRDFTKTPEPRGGTPRKGARPIFVIQKHDARRMHYDFRLEVDGVLKSWAVPKGPSTDPKEKRLAVPTEDHPVEYADFEGVIPEDAYGGGTVLVWDAGAYGNLMADKDPPREMAEAFEEGHIEVWLEGKKLRGGYALVRTEPKKREKPRWLLIKMRDEQADARRNPVSTEPQSVITGRTIDEVAREEPEE